MQVYKSRITQNHIAYLDGDDFRHPCPGVIEHSEQQVIPLEQAIRRLTSLPAENLRIRRRGLLRPGYFADVVVFDANSIADHATFEEPHQYSTGVLHVIVNGIPVLTSGEHTGATPGRVVRGPGWRGWNSQGRRP